MNIFNFYCFHSWNLLKIEDTLQLQNENGRCICPKQPKEEIKVSIEMNTCDNCSARGSWSFKNYNLHFQFATNGEMYELLNENGLSMQSNHIECIVNSPIVVKGLTTTQNNVNDDFEVQEQIFNEISV